MAQVSRLLKQCLGISIAVSTAISVLLGTSSAVLGNSNSSDDPPPKTNNRAGGSRGCGIWTEATPNMSALILLTPNNRVGKTVATPPTFAWFVRDAGSWPMEFRLYEYDPSSQKNSLITEIKDESFNSTPGIMVLSFEKSLPKLSIGKRYLWQLELKCNPKQPSSNFFAEAEFKVVALDRELNRRLSSTKSKSERTALYLQADLWYEALATVLAVPSRENGRRISQMRLSLLKEVAVGEEEIKEFREGYITLIQR